MVRIFPSLISCNLLRLASTVDTLEPAVAGFHLDIMDFNFVPNLTWGPPFINALAGYTKKQLQIHLMVEHPGRYLDRMALRKEDVVILHVEAVPYKELIVMLNTIQQYGWIPSLAIKPSTPITDLGPLLPYCQHILLMSVNPGFSGQQFIPETFQRLSDLVNLRSKLNTTFTICLDGGINNTNIDQLIHGGMDEAAIASAIFSTPDILTTVHSLQRK